MTDTCSVRGCAKRAIARTWCSMHYTRWDRYGDVSITRQLGPQRRSPGDYPTLCSINGCDGAHRAHGYCQRHYLKLRKYGDPLGGIRVDRGYHSPVCQIEGCGRKFFCRYYCRNHYETIIAGPLRRGRESAHYVPFTPEQVNARIAYYGGKCWMCRSQPFEEIDHVKPLSKGGAHMVANMRPACHDCNTRKGARWPFVGMERALA